MDKNTRGAFLAICSLAALWGVLWGVMMNVLLMVHTLQWPIKINLIMGAVEFGIGICALMAGISASLRHAPLTTGISIGWTLLFTVEATLLGVYVYGGGARDLPPTWHPAPGRHMALNQPLAPGASVDATYLLRMLIHFYIVLKGLAMACAGMGLIYVVYSTPIKKRGPEAVVPDAGLKTD